MFSKPRSTDTLSPSLEFLKKQPMSSSLLGSVAAATERPMPTDNDTTKSKNENAGERSAIRQAKKRKPTPSIPTAQGKLQENQPPPLSSEIIAAIGGFCCRQTLNDLMLASEGVRDACREVSKPWPTNLGCSLVSMIYPDHDDLPEEPEDCDDDWLGDYFESKEYKQYLEDLRMVVPPPSKLIMLHDNFGPSFLALEHNGICIDDHTGQYEVPRLMQVWSKGYGLMFEERYPYNDTKPAITPPIGQCSSQFLILPVKRNEDPGVRMVEMMTLPRRRSHETGQKIIKSFSLPCNQHIESMKCITSEDGPCLIFMDRGQSAVKLCKITMEIGTTSRGESIRSPELGEPRVLVSDPSRTGDLNTRRSTLASFCNAERCIIAFSYDFLDECINIYDLKRNVSIAVPTPARAGWIRDVEFSPDGKTLVIAHCTFGPEDITSSSSCAISVYDCNFEQIECILKQRPKLFPIKGSGYCSHISFSPKGAQIALEWHPKLGRRRTGGTADQLFKPERVGVIDLSSVRDAADDQTSLEVDFLNETIWERFALS